MTVPPDGRIVIVGTGIAGASAAETLRKEGYDGSIVYPALDTRSRKKLLYVLQ